MARWIILAVVLCIGCLFVRAASATDLTQAEIQSRRCLNCHAQQRMAQLAPSDRAMMVAPATQPTTPVAVRPDLYVPSDTLSSGPHSKLSCTDCHKDATGLPHAARLRPVDCNVGCHSPQRSDYLQGVHAEAVARGAANAPTCSTCHGGHEILPKSDRRSRIHPLNIVKICGDCHRQHTSADGLDGAAHIQKYLESVHGRAIAKGGLAVAATCADCHGSHRVLPSKDARSTVNRAAVATTCGKCHIGLSETYLSSVHGQELAQGNPKAPVCSDCHTAHAITRTDAPAFMLDIVAECGSCHDKPPPGSTRRTSLYETYRRSYHGQVTSLGSTRAARCSDCHGAHDIRKMDDPASRLSTTNRLNTCQSCHKDAPANLALFDAHADHRDGTRYPLLHGVWLYFVIMMSFAFGFYGLHSLLWLGRSTIERVKHGPHQRHVANGHAIQRFNKVDRINHAFVIISFFGLALTGLPLLYSDQHWARTLAGWLGGVRTAGALHRVFAVMLICNFIVHGFGLANRVRKYGVRKLLFGPYTMLPRFKDVTDCLGMFRWFFMGGKKPKFDRWTYWEKFDYVAEVGGSLIIGLSGLLLWFPLFFAKYLPGWWFNIATVVHGYEALLAVGFIFTIHFFNAHLRLEKFPVDDVMFTGRLPESEFKEEREAEYERLVASGEIAKLRVAPPPRGYRVFAICAGLIAMAIGTTLVVLIILAGLKLM
jgi:cytochrome b subunit of formate dehydrogenase